ncbi:MAG: hypothetical protein V4501_12935 [Pseudomonadota bacterium]
MLSGTTISIATEEEAAFEEFVKALESAENSKILKDFSISMKKYMLHAQRDISYTPSKKLNDRHILLKAKWSYLISQNGFNHFSQTSLAIIEADIKNNCVKLRTHFHDHNENLDDLIHALIIAIENNTPSVDTSLFVPGHIQAGFINFKKRLETPYIAERQLGKDAFAAGQKFESIEIFKRGAAKIEEMPERCRDLQVALYQFKFYIAHAHLMIAKDFEMENNYIKAYQHARLAVIEYEIGERQLSDEKIIAINIHKINSLRKYYRETIRKHITHLQQENNFEGVIFLLLNILKDQEISLISKPPLIHIDRYLALTNNKLAKKMDKKNQPWYAREFFMLAIKQAEQILNVPAPEPRDRAFLAQYQEDFISFLYSQTVNLNNNNKHSAAADTIILIFNIYKKINPKTIRTKSAILKQKSYIEAEKCILPFLMSNIDWEKPSNGQQRISDALAHDQALLFFINKAIIAIALSFSYEYFQDNKYMRAKACLQTLTSDITFLMPAADQSLLFNPNHVLNELLCSIIVLRDYFLLTPEHHRSERDKLYIIQTDRFIGSILMRQSHDFHIHYNKTHLPSINMVRKAQELFDKIPHEKITHQDTENKETCSFKLEYFTQSLEQKINKNLRELKTRLRRKTNLFDNHMAQKFTVSLNEMKRIIDTYLNSNGIHRLYELQNHLTVFFSCAPRKTPHLSLLKSTQEKITCLASLYEGHPEWPAPQQTRSATPSCSRRLL